MWAEWRLWGEVKKSEPLLNTSILNIQHSIGIIYAHKVLDGVLYSGKL